MGPRWAKMAPRSPKIAPRWRKIAPRWGQEGPRRAKIAQDRPKLRLPEVMRDSYVLSRSRAEPAERGRGEVNLCPGTGD